LKKFDDDMYKLAYEKIASYLTKQASFLKTKISKEKILNFVEKYEKANETTEVNLLTLEIETLEKDLIACPALERYAKMRKELEAELKKKREALMKLKTGTNNVQMFDFMDGASQLY
jgi:hypothetical protein